MSNISLHIPAFGELEFRQKLYGDKKTMEYNGGVVNFPKDKWRDWYDRWIAVPQIFLLIRRLKWK